MQPEVLLPSRISTGRVALVDENRLVLGVTLTDSTNTMVGSTCDDALWGVALWVSIMIGEPALSSLATSSDEDEKATFEGHVDVAAKGLYEEHGATSRELAAMLSVISGHGRRQRLGTPVYRIHISALREGLRLAVNAYKECGTCPLRARIEMYRKLVASPHGIEPHQATSLKELAGVV